MSYTLKKDGFQKFSLQKKKLIILKRFIKNIKIIAKNTNKKYNLKFDSLENYHNQLKVDTNFNNLKLQMIKKINSCSELNNLIFKILETELKSLLGPDIAGQKNINLVIQRPYDNNFVPLHRDSPPNSPHEVVVWLPLVNCYKSMSFKFLNKKNSETVLKMIKKNANENKINKFVKKNGVGLETKKGEFIIFWTGIYHFATINSEKDCRWSINLRYKNLYSPYGMKGYLDFFEIKSLSSISDLALEHK